jgi:hypothetical protein
MRIPKLRVLTGILALTGVWILTLALTGIAAADVAGQFRVAIGNEASFANSAVTAQRNSYVILQAWEAGRAAELKAANPNLEVLVYQNLSAMAQGTSATGLSSSGVNYAEADTAHPEWFLQNPAGGRISEGDYSWLWMADIGDPGYQQQWTSNVLKLLASGPWDGVMMDDTNTTAKYHTEPSNIAKYPTDAAYQAAVRSMLAYAGPRIQAAGKLAIPNIGSWSEYPEVAKEWLKYVSGGIDEMFAKWSATPGQGYRDTEGWKTQIEEIQSAERMGKRFLAITQAAASDTQAIRYGWASVLLAADGHTAYTAAANYDSETWSSEYEAQVGEPTSSATEVAGGVWEREFTGGLVLVNPTTTTVKVNFGGTYSGSGLTDASSATMPPNTALILSGAGGEKKISTETTPGSTGQDGSAGAGLAGAGTGGAGTSGAATTGGGSELAGAGLAGAGSAGAGSPGAATPPSTGSTGVAGSSEGGSTAVTDAGVRSDGRGATHPVGSGRHRRAARTVKGRASLRRARAARTGARRRRPSHRARSHAR